MVPSGPRGYPLVGSLPQFRRDPLGFLLSVARQHGDLARLTLGGQPVFLVTHPDHIRHVLQDHHHRYRKSPRVERIKPLFGEGLTTSEDSLWRRQRRLMQPVFQHQRLAALVPVITEATAAMLERWQRVADGGQPLDVEVEMLDLTRAIILRALFGNQVGGHVLAVRGALTIALEAVNARIWALFELPEWLPTPRNRRLHRARRTLDTFVYRMIAEHRQRGGATHDLLSMLVGEAEIGQQMSDSQLHDELMTLLVAGHTTTAAALSWIWYLLAQHSGIACQVETELHTVLGGRPPSLRDLPALSWTRWVIDEALRLYPPTWVTGRTPLEVDEIGGYRIPVHSLVLLSPYVTHRHPKFWEDPEGFDPERFTAVRSAGRPQYAYFPFGGGPRLCIGRGLALMEIEMIVAMVAQGYRLHLVPGRRVEPQATLTLRPRQGLWMTVVRRTCGISDVVDHDGSAFPAETLGNGAPDPS